jgi:WhiB family redox-sensing transcriptional regulator
MNKSEAQVIPCRTEDADLWFAERPEQLGRAQRLCAACPIRRGCLADALARREPWGVWGGEIFQRGRVVAFKRGRGRPPKSTPRPGALAKSHRGRAWSTSFTPWLSVVRAESHGVELDEQPLGRGGSDFPGRPAPAATVCDGA